MKKFIRLALLPLFAFTISAFAVTPFYYRGYNSDGTAQTNPVVLAAYPPAVNGITVYDDFAHHPTAIAATLQGLRAATPRGRLLAVIDKARQARTYTSTQEMAWMLLAARALNLVLGSSDATVLRFASQSSSTTAFADFEDFTSSNGQPATDVYQVRGVDAVYGDNVVVNLPRFNWEERNIYAAAPTLVPYYPVVAYRVMQNPTTGLDAIELIPNNSNGMSKLRVWYYPNPKNSAYTATITNPKGSPAAVITPGTYYNVNVNGGSGSGMQATVVVDATGSIQSVDVTSYTSGYTNPFTYEFNNNAIYSGSPKVQLVGTMNICTVDGRAGWEEWVVVDAAVKLLTKEESDTSQLEREAARIWSRIMKCAEAGALATETTLELADPGGLANVLPNETLATLSEANFKLVGGIRYGFDIEGEKAAVLKQVAFTGNAMFDNVPEDEYVEGAFLIDSDTEIKSTAAEVQPSAVSVAKEGETTKIGWNGKSGTIKSPSTSRPDAASAAFLTLSSGCSRRSHTSGRNDAGSGLLRPRCRPATIDEVRQTGRLACLKPS